MELIAFVLAVLLSICSASLVWIGVSDIAENRRFSGTVALAVALVVALTVGLIINVNFLPVAQ